MIRLISGDEYSSEKIQTIFADTKEEVPANGKDTVVEGFNGVINPGSVIYTTTLDIAVLSSDDTWVWN